MPLSVFRSSASGALGWPLLGATALSLAACKAPEQHEPSKPASMDAADADAARQGAAANEKLAKSQKIETAFGPVRIDQYDLVDGSHADGGRLAVSYLGSRKDYPKTVVGGSFGNFGDWAVDNGFSSNPVIVSKSGGTWQGYTCTWTELTELKPNGPVRLALIEDSFDDRGAATGPPQSVQGKIVSVERDRSFTMQFEGTRRFAAVYTRKGNGYELQGGPDRKLEGC